MSSIRILVDTDDVTEQVEEGATFSNVDPGGFEAAQFSFPRQVGIKRAQKVRITDGLETVFLGRVQRVGRKLAGGRGTTVGCEGAGAVLKDNTIREIWRDIDLSRWQGATVQRKLDLIDASVDDDDPTVAPDPSSGAPSLQTSLNGPWARAHRCEALYDAQGIPIGEVYYAWKKGSTVGTAAPWGWDVFLQDSADGAGGSDTSGSLVGAGPGSGTLAVGASSRVFAMVRLFHTGTDANDGRLYPLYWTALPVYGAHGLPLRGSEPSAGFYPTDIAVNVARRAGVPAGLVIDATSFVVQHSVYLDPVEHEQAIDDMGKLAGAYHYGTWDQPSVLSDQPQFDIHPLPDTATCFAAREDLDDFEPEEQLDKLYDTCEVTYTDMAGSSRVATATRTVPELQEAGISRTLPATLGTGDAASAAVYGQMLLLLAEQQGRAAGPASTTLPIKLPGGGTKPAHQLRAGKDRIRITDMPDIGLGSWSRAEFNLKRVEGTIGKQGISTQLEFGTGADLQEVLNARLQLATDVAQFGR